MLFGVFSQVIHRKLRGSLASALTAEHLSPKSREGTSGCNKKGEYLCQILGMLFQEEKEQIGSLTGQFQHFYLL